LGINFNLEFYEKKFNRFSSFETETFIKFGGFNVGDKCSGAKVRAL
jgi:hypothetical protein